MQKFQPLSAKIAIAVSGGSDSMALALCIKAWGQRDIVALIIDHGLRKESADEARVVQERLSSIGIPSEILRWDHGPVTSGLHERARAARYELMIEACSRLGAADLFTAHHQDDQAETILMRLAKASGIDGLAGISPQSRRENIRLVRPFLSVRKERLIATCRSAGLAFVIDPSNQSEKFSRGRLRKVMPLLAQEGLTVEGLIHLGARAAETKEALDYYTHIFLNETASADIGGAIKINRSRLCQIPRAVSLRVIVSCLRYVHDSLYDPEHHSLSSLLESILDPSVETTRTLYGCMASIAADQVMFLREPAAATDSQPLRPGQTILWDRRWLVTALEGTPVTTLRALGEQPHALLDQLAPFLRRRIPQGRVRASLPGLWLEDRLHAIPSFDEKGLFSLRYRKLSFP